MRRYVLVCLALVSIGGLAQSPYISHVWEYQPAPGQFVNDMPYYDDGDDEEAMRVKVEEAIAYNAGEAITLGGWGGYVIFGFDHEIINVPSQNDFIVLGNAFYADINHPENGGSSEPGIIYVSRDANQNGLPDDPWYEIAGSEYASSTRNYRVTYFRPADNHVRTPNMAEDLIDTTYIAWRDINGATGYMSQNRYHRQAYYPLWQSASRWVFEGTLLPPNTVPYQEDGHTKYIMYNFPYGYADNHPNTSAAAQINIDWAVTPAGQPANLTGIHFVKVQTGTHQQCGWIGENSTEVSGATDLHPSALPTEIEDPVTLNPSPVTATKILRNGHLYIIINNQIKYVL